MAREVKHTCRIPLHRAALIVALLVAASGCATETRQPDDTSVVDPGTGPGSDSVVVAPDFSAPPFVVNVVLTDEGFEPATIFIPAGRQVRMVLRNRGTHEHHYRVIGLIPSELRWYMYPDVDEYELDSEEIGYIDDIEHILHHMTPEFVPFKEASLSGIRPIGTEVHGYAQASGDVDVMTFYALTTGEFEVEDVAYPEITGKVVVFES